MAEYLGSLQLLHELQQAAGHMHATTLFNIFERLLDNTRRIIVPPPERKQRDADKDDGGGDTAAAAAGGAPAAPTGSWRPPAPTAPPAIWGRRPCCASARGAR